LVYLTEIKNCEKFKQIDFEMRNNRQSYQLISKQ
jgi:hypothetical protein